MALRLFSSRALSFARYDSDLEQRTEIFKHWLNNPFNFDNTELMRTHLLKMKYTKEEKARSLKLVTLKKKFHVKEKKTDLLKNLFFDQ